MNSFGPERLGGQGLDRNQEESGNRALLALLTDPEVEDQVDLVATCRERGEACEVWSRRWVAPQLRLDGSSLASDPREVLYGSP